MMGHEELSLLIGRIAAGEATLDEIAGAIGAVEITMKRANDVQAELDAALLNHVQTQGALVIGCTVYYAGYRTITTVIDKLAVLNALLANTGGDLGSATAYLVAQPYKHGSIRRLLPLPLFNSLFKTTRDTHLGRRLMKADTRFSHQSGGDQDPPAAAPEESPDLDDESSDAH